MTQPVGAQTVAGWATGFDAGPPDEDLSQSVLRDIVTNNNNALFEPAGQPAIAADGTLTYTPKVGGAPGVATVTVQVRDNGGTSEGHGAVDTSDPQSSRSPSGIAGDIDHVPERRRLDVDELP